MSKGRVWNKGKRNGGGGPPEGKSSKAIAAANKSSIAPPQEESGMSEQAVVKEVTRVDQIKPMNRANWVSRPARITPEKKGTNNTDTQQ
ncbi:MULTISPECIES: hypothetical protein [Paenibacillus]|uniref:Uncharacterized protein n=1 Tax=Paenibacillus baimaensis TaxID=2982185 RepID=A0ABT2UHD4_9BACL|nr:MULTISPECIES: hypothetical protein [unclassified Paenibacillus]MCU6794058.1 hypothetical protein [Paenibacillus sp. WQ 127069]OMF11981.1 hypothetical protein BK127_23890 [Paenibacillus sp. FSL H7-0331]